MGSRITHYQESPHSVSFGTSTGSRKIYYYVMSRITYYQDSLKRDSTVDPSQKSSTIFLNIINFLGVPCG